MNTPVADVKAINELLARYGVKFGIYKNGTFNEQLFPFDAIPRVISAGDFSDMEKGLVQRVDALNLFLKDIYSDGKIIKDGIIPDDFVYISKGYLAPCEGITPPKGIYSHISGIDLVQAKDGTWYILEDNLRIPSGASYPLIARELCRMTSPGAFENNHIADNRDYASLLRGTMDYVNCGGINVILTPGRYNAAYFEHSYLAEKTGAVLVQNTDLFVEDNILYMKDYQGGKTRVGAVYRRISDEYLDPMTFLPESLIGVPHIIDAYRAGNVAIINAPGNGVADDKGIYYFVPKMIKYYLGEEPVLKNAPTYLPFYEEDRKYVLDNLEKLIIKDVSEAGGYGVVFGRDMTKEQLDDWRRLITEQSRRFIAQEVIDFIDLEVMENDKTVMRKADLRAFVLSGEKTRLKELEREGSICEGKEILIIPCVNYYSMNIGKRFWTMDNTDINRMFPGYDLGETTQRIADGLFKEIQGYTYGVQMASFYQEGDFLPHVKLMETGFTSHEDMNDFGLPYAFVRKPRPYDTTTLNYNWQVWGTKAFSLYTNATDNIDESSAKTAVDAIVRFMVRRGIIKTNVSSGYLTEIISENRLIQIHSPMAGICRSYVRTGDELRKGDLLCEITDPLEGDVISKIFSPVNGIVFFRYSRPVEFEKSVLYKIIHI